MLFGKKFCQIVDIAGARAMEHYGIWTNCYFPQFAIVNTVWNKILQERTRSICSLYNSTLSEEVSTL